MASWTSAVGRVYLAFQTSDTRDRLLQVLARDAEFPEDREVGRDLDALAKVLDGVRSSGYAIAKAKNRSAILAVPIIGTDGTGAVGSLALRYFAASLTDAEAVTRNLGKMQEAAAQIATRTVVRTH